MASNIQDLINSMETLLMERPHDGEVRIRVNGRDFNVEHVRVRASMDTGESVMMMPLTASEGLMPVGFAFEIVTDDGIEMSFKAVAAEILYDGPVQVVVLWTARGLTKK